MSWLLLSDNASCAASQTAEKPLHQLIIDVNHTTRSLKGIANPLEEILFLK
jgi:hypothetical protein